MRILCLTPDLGYPPSNGITRKTIGMLEALSTAHDCSVMGILNSTFDEERFAQDLPRVDVMAVYPRASAYGYGIRVLRNFLRGWPPSAARILDSSVGRQIHITVAKGDWDVVILDMYTLAGLVPKSVSSPCVLSINDAHSRGYWNTAAALPFSVEKLRAYTAYLFYRWYEARVLRRFRIVHVVAESDRDYLMRLCPTANVRVVPLAVPEEYFNCSVSDYGSRRVLIHCNFTVPGMRHSLEKVVRYLHSQRLGHDIQWVLLGRGATQVRQVFSAQYRVEGVEYAANHPAFLASFPIALFPETGGSGTKHRVIQAMATGSCVVCSSAIAEGITRDCDDWGLVGATVPELWESLRWVIDDASRAARIGMAGRSLVKRMYGRETTARQWEEMIRTVR